MAYWQIRQIANFLYRRCSIETRYRTLNIWKESKALVLDIYNLTNKFPNFEKYGLASQMQRAAISIPSNIAEGSGRSTKKDFRLFLNHARGSIYELMTQLEISYDLKYITKEQFEYIENKITILTKRINSFIRKLSE